LYVLQLNYYKTIFQKEQQILHDDRVILI